MYLSCGVDEAGRGPLAGPVYAAAVILDPSKPIKGLNDSKKLTEKQRERLFDEIINHSLAYSIASSSVIEIDTINILQASLLAMKRAVEQLQVLPHIVLVDGNKAPSLNLPVKTIVQGDATVAEISAASILAKVSRDRVMVDFDLKYPNYGFAKHKGYGTKEHLLALESYGILDIHRRSFAPIKHMC